MKKKFSALTKDIEVQREDLRAMAEKEEELKSTISNLEDEIQLHKKDIRERDETIGEKEKKIYELKKKRLSLIAMMQPNFSVSFFMENKEH